MRASGQPRRRLRRDARSRATTPSACCPRAADTGLRSRPTAGLDDRAACSRSTTASRRRRATGSSGTSTSATPTNLGAPLASLPRFQAAVGEIEALLHADERLLGSLAGDLDAGGDRGRARGARDGPGKRRRHPQRRSRVAEQAVALIGNAGLDPRTTRCERHLRDVLCSRIHTPQDDTILAATPAARRCRDEEVDHARRVHRHDRRPSTARRPTPGAGPVDRPGYTARVRPGPRGGAASTGCSSATAPSQPDGLQVAAYAAAHTERLGFLIAHRPGFVAPDRRRARVRDARPVHRRPHRRAHHLRRQRRRAAPRRRLPRPRTSATRAPTSTCRSCDRGVDGRRRRSTSTARYYRFEDFVSEVRPCQQPRIPIYFGGSSEAGVSRSARRHADVFALLGRAAGARPPSRSPRCAPPRRPPAATSRRASASRSARSSARTEEQAWERAHRILEVARPTSTSRGRSAKRFGARQRRRRRTPARSGCSPPPSAASCTTARCGRRSPRPSAPAATRPRSSARPRPSPQALLDYVDIGVTHAADPRLRPARGRRRLRPAPAPARAAGGRTPGLARSRRRP